MASLGVTKRGVCVGGGGGFDGRSSGILILRAFGTDAYIWYLKGKTFRSVNER